MEYFPTPSNFLVAENKRSDYSSNKLFLHIRQIRRDLNILEIFYQETESLRWVEWILSKVDHISFLRHLGVAVYTEASVPDLLLSEATSYVLNLCLLPRNNTELSQFKLDQNSYGDLLSGLASEGPDSQNYFEIKDFDEVWLKFKKYSLLNPDEVNIFIRFSLFTECSGFHRQVFPKKQLL